MDENFIPKVRVSEERTDLLWKIVALIKDKLESKAITDLEAMSEQDKIENGFLSIVIDVPKSKKGIEKAIDEFINDFQPDKDNGEELLEYLEITDIKPSIEAKNEVKVYLQSLSTEELCKITVFGPIVTEEEAIENIENAINTIASHTLSRLLKYANEEIFTTHKNEEDILYAAAKENLIDYFEIETPTNEDINSEVEGIKQCIKEHPLEFKAAKRGLYMTRINKSDSSTLNTVKTILNNGVNPE